MRRYAVLPQLAGTWFLVVGFLARLPVAMLGIGVMLLVTTTSGSVARGGLATGAASLGTAVLAPVQGRLADRLGQRPVLLVAAAVNAAGLAMVTVAATRGLPTAVLLAACFVAGGCVPQVGALARVRWLRLTRARPEPMNAAMSWESTADEVTFVLGPALVGVIAATTPAATLLVAAVLAAVFATAFALHPTAPPGRARAATTSPTESGAGPSEASEPTAPETTGTGAAPHTGADHHHVPLGRVLRLVLVPMLGMLSMGAFFGSSQAAVTGIATAAGQPGTAGLLYAVMGVGSAVTALAMVAVPETVSLRRRWLVGGAGMTLVMVASLTVGSLGATAVALLAVGLFVGPTLVTLFSACGQAAPPGEAGTAMTLLVSANVVGVAIGAATGGRVAEAIAAAGGDPATAFAVPALASAVVTAAGVLLRGRRPGAASAGHPPPGAPAAS